MNAYDPYKYWNSRINPNKAVDAQILPWESKFLAEFISDQSNIFEFGPGIGRLFECYRGQSVTTLDISRKYEDRLAATATDHRVKLSQHFRVSVFERFPFADESFSIGVAAQVLFHIPFHAINFTIAELTRVCSLVTIINTHDPKWPTERDPSEGHCFAHDFYEIADRGGLHLDVRRTHLNAPVLFTLARR